MLSIQTYGLNFKVFNTSTGTESQGPAGAQNPPPVFMKLYYGRGNPAPTLTISTYEAFGIIRACLFLSKERDGKEMGSGMLFCFII
jgi:hypothetical protein